MISTLKRRGFFMLLEHRIIQPHGVCTPYSCDGNAHMSEVESDWLDDLGSGQALRDVCD